MAFIEITIPPLPHYIASGYNSIPKGGQHPSRSNIQVFDLLITTSGCFYIGEEDERFEVGVGQAVILRPDRYHFATKVCEELTYTYWLHFHVGGAWELMKPSAVAAVPLEDPAPEDAEVEAFAVEPFTMRIPQFTTLQHPEKMYEVFDQLLQLQPRAHVNSVRFAQQQLFQDILYQLAASAETAHASASRACAEKAASYLRQHFRESVTAKQLGDELNFHPVYIARCMQKEYGCSPLTYLLKLRVGQAKLLLLQTELPIAHIAQEVGFEQAAYFAASFTKLEGMSPRSYRQQFAHRS
ncbi:AraC family transcriptional regulator [Paenibacillus qinlingensis]|uniref:AraC-like DNA-binding protein n=1 Tax=Paenibacillus qinlingensis TaxID=1837343 RepID=A0ABU1NXD3_9BACL|nr:AraC family transcriptional regulator [Paenibacillus qinlingensis]MDR6552110.1 AraC-like DNA-binding protein [Paenibacillus qinlingensis]